jgi:hypothetical protein
MRSSPRIHATGSSPSPKRRASDMEIKTQIRNGVFETNSSSVHNFTMDLTIGENDICTKEEAIEDVLRYNNIFPNTTVYDPKTKILDLSVLPPDAMSFGREYTRVTGFFGKVLYSLAAFNVENDKAAIDSIMAFLTDFLGLSKIKCEKVKGAYWNDDKEISYNLGDIDHQSVGYLQSFLIDRNITVKDFVLGKRYVVTTTCDG